MRSHFLPAVPFTQKIGKPPHASERARTSVAYCEIARKGEARVSSEAALQSEREEETRD
jgi:hypothetical protein